MKKTFFFLVLSVLTYSFPAMAVSDALEGCLSWGMPVGYVETCLAGAGLSPREVGDSHLVVSEKVGDVPMSFVFGFDAGLSGVIGAVKNRPFSGEVYKSVGMGLVSRYGDPVNVQQDLMAVFWATAKGDVRMYPEVVDGLMNVVVVITPSSARR